jgi:Helix-turn-helix domain
MDDDIRKALTGLTVPVVVAGRALGLGRNAAYAAAKRGEIPSVKIGGAIRVPTAPLRRLLGLDREVA